jgi:hypothetical protein
MVDSMIIKVKVDKFSDTNTNSIPNLLKKPMNGGNPVIENKVINKPNVAIGLVLFSKTKSVIFLENLSL